MKIKHPIQPLVFDKYKIIRFKKNEIVRVLLDTHPSLDMNKLACMDFTPEDRAQFAQLIGYSVSGFGDLSYVPRKMIRECDAQAEKLWKAKKKA